MAPRLSLSLSPLARLLLLLALALAARGFYMPPEFAVDAVNGSAFESGSGAYGPEGGVFDVRNRTADSFYSSSSSSSSSSSAVAPAPTAAVSKEGVRPDGAPTHGSTEGDSAGSPGLRARDVWSPKITDPDAETVWTAGARVTVRWDTSNRPRHVTNYEGRVVLGHYGYGDSTNEHLDVEHPLAEGFNLTRGHVDVTVPHVSPSNEYIIVLFGDSGNASPKFTILE